MTRIGYGDPLGIPNAKWGKGGISYVWGPFTFDTDYGAGSIPSPYTEAGALGSITLTDTTNKASISGGAFRWSGSVTTGDPQILSSTLLREPGLMIRHKSDLANRTQIGISNILVLDTALGIFAGYNAGINVNDEQDIAWILWDIGGVIFSMNTPASPRLAWVHVSGSEVPTNFVLISIGNVSGECQLQSAYARVVTGVLSERHGIASQNVALPVSGTSYTATADAITDLTLVAPNPLADQAGYRYRYTDDDNCWHAYLNSAGAYRLDSVAAGTATNRVNVASSVGAGETRTIRTISNGSLHDAFTLAATTWTKRGSQINVSHLNTNTAIRPYTTGSWAMSNLRSYPTTDPRYDAELNKT